MFEKILRLGKEAAIYGLSSVVGRFLNFLLVPFYTNFLLPAEYGVIANLYSYIAFATIVYGYGMDAAYMRFVASLEIGTKKENFSTPFVSLLMTSFVLSGILHLFSSSVAVAIGMQQTDGTLVQYAAWILFFDALALVPFSYLRMENRAGTFATIRILGIVITIVLNIVLIVGLQMKAEGVLLANVVASAATFLIHLRFIIPNFTRLFSWKLYKELLKFGLPYIPAGLASIALQVIDRPILKSLTDDATVGVYQANYRLGIFMMLIVGMFDYAWRPFFLHHAEDEDAKPLFARVFTYFLFVAFSVFVVLTLFIEDLIRIKIGGVFFFHPDYWAGVYIVPVVLLAYAFNGAYANFIVGVYLKKKTFYLPYISGAAAAINIVANYLLIPVVGFMGAAYATLVSYAVLAVGIYLASQRFYRVEYEWQKIAGLTAAAGLTVALYRLFVSEIGTLDAFLLKGGLVLLFGMLVLFARVIDAEELKQAKRLLSSLIRSGSQSS